MAERKTLDRNHSNRRVAPTDDDDDAGIHGKEANLSSSDSSSSSNRFITVSLNSRRERQARRRVQPLGEDESEEARVRGVPVPAVGRLQEEPAGEPHAEVRKSTTLLYLTCACVVHMYVIQQGMKCVLCRPATTRGTEKKLSPVSSVARTSHAHCLQSLDRGPLQHAAIAHSSRWVDAVVGIHNGALREVGS